MKNGEYILVKAPDDYPYKKYRNKYCYEHVLVYWQNFGEIPNGYHIHHKDENKHNNNIENLELISMSEHTKKHNLNKGALYVELKCPNCKKHFEREKRTTYLVKNNLYTCCSRKCSGSFSNTVGKERELGIKENLVREFKKYKK